MFNKSSFCHIASNNRNEQKGSVFIYKTTDTLAQVTQSGYFNEKLIDINVHDLIIHVQYDPVARTLKKSVLIVTERTLDNVETTPILDQTIGEDIDQLGDQIDQLGDQVAGIGGQVAGIEKKIPKNASAQNQLATKSEIPTVPTNISAFNNDSGYITSSALTPYATTQELNDGLATKQPAGDYATNSALTSGLALKVAIAQGAENAGKILKIDDSGNVIVADESGGASLPILYHTWSDHLLNDVSWLRADTFSWQSGDVYTAAYNHLVDDLDGKTPQTDTIGDITITYYRADDGHKICLPGRESELVALYNKTGVAWYYILDIINRQFKLPRTKWGFTGLRDSVGGYVAPGLPNITGTFQPGSGEHTAKLNNLTGAFGSSATGTGRDVDGGSSTATTIAKFDASKSNSIYGNSTTVQPPATQMYLYFYVGNFEQSAIEQTAGLNAEMFNDLNAHKVIEFQAPTSANGYTWYRKYADGWVEQGGGTDVAAGNNNITLPIPMLNVNYTALITRNSGASSTSQIDIWRKTSNDTTTTFCVYAAVSDTGAIWVVSGMAA